VPRFRIATFVTDRAAYAEMRDSFEAAGFVAPSAVYDVLSDSIEDPFAAVRRLGMLGDRFVLLVHQDVRCDHGETVATLDAALDALTLHDPTWALAGNAGAAPDGAVVRHLADPWGADWAAAVPQRVVTLDENFLVLRTARRPRCSEQLSGFHLYGADACLCAERDGSTCYVLGFRLSHLSGGSHVGYQDAVRAFADVWSKGVWRPRYVPTTLWPIALARPRLLRLVLNHPGVRRRLLGS
jgi:hypothetical protein